MRLLILFGALIILTSSLGFAQVPQTLSYQGLLTDNSGVPLADGSYAVTFRFYSTVTGGTAITSRGPLTVNTFKGLFMTTLGDGTTDNAALPFSLADQEFFIGITISPSTTELAPRVKITAIPYAFVANSVKNVDATVINSGTLPIARIADNSISNAKLATGIDATKLTGTLALANGGTGASTAATARTNLGLAIGTDVQAFDADLADLADGTLTGSKVDGTTLTTVSATNVTTGTLALANGGTGATTVANARTNLGLAIGTNVQAFDADLTDLADGTLSGAAISLTGTDASKLASGTTAQRPSSPVEGQIRYNSTEKVMEYYNGTNWYFMVPKVAFIRDEKPSGTNGGNISAGVWTTRNLNTLDQKSGDSFVSLNTNQFTLTPGEYIIEASAPGANIDGHRVKLREITGGTDIAFGTTEVAAINQGYVVTRSYLMSRIEITTNKIYEISHRANSTAAADQVLGPASGQGINEIYTTVKIIKLR